MNRRAFLRNLTSAGACFLAGGAARGKSLLIVADSSDSRISNIEWILYRTGRQQADSSPEYRCAVRITSAGGAQGWADLTGSAMADSTTAAGMRDILLGRDPADVEIIWQRLYERGIPLVMLSAVDIALWDLLARIEGKPVHALLGAKRQNVAVFASTGFNLGEPQKYAEYALASKEQGVYGCKIQPYVEWGAGRNGPANAGFPDRDMAAYEAARQAVGPDYPCMADNACSYTFNDALRVGQRLDDLKYEWYQSPMPENDDWLDRYVALAAGLTTPICAPAMNPGSYTSRARWVQAKGCDIAAIDAHHGGFTACRKLASACEAAGIPLQLPDIGSDSYPHLQLIATVAPSLIKCIEVRSLSRETSIQPGRTTPEPTLDDQGCIAIPQTLGMGLELDWKYVVTHRLT
jgi:D-galactarolactone cycloisomerase